MTTLLALALAHQTGALQLPSFFSDHMVLQRDVPCPIFGTATPGSYIEVDVDGQSAAGQTDPQGHWTVRLRPMHAGGPFQLTVSGDGSASFKDVMVGDVWLASGQSNMEFHEESAGDFEQAKTEADPAVRMFTVSHLSSEDPQTNVKGDWQPAYSYGLGYFSAVGYSFAAELHRQLHVPIGIIHASWGGTPAESWVSRDGLEANVTTRTILDSYLEAVRNIGDQRADYQARLSVWNADRVDKVNEGVSKGWAAETADTSDWKKVSLPSTIKNIEGIQANGAFWFRRSFEVQPSLVGKTLLLELGPIDNFDRTYVNGTEVGFSDSEVPNAWVTPRSYTVPASLIHPGTNTVAVRVFSTAGVGGFTGTANQMVLRAVDSLLDAVALDGDWLYKPERIAQPEGPAPAAPIGPGSSWAPGGLYNGMIAPLPPFALKGIIWYQGEANVSRAAQYRDLFSALIGDWRQKWSDPSLPFYFVQLPNFGERPSQPGESDWAELREAQAAALKLPDTGMATIIDIGEADNIHPKNKREVGRRLAIDALKNVYHSFADVAASPSAKTTLFRGNEIWVRFDSAGKGLRTTDDQPPRSFAIAGNDHKFHWADAKIRGEWVILSSPEVSVPAAARYAWADNPDVNLVGSTGLPATPFRSDNWER